MRFLTIAKANVLDDADPNSSAPAAARCTTLSELLGSKQNAELGGVAISLRVLTAANALNTDGAADAIPWIYDEASATWTKAPVSLTALPVVTTGLVPLPSAGMSTKVFVQLKNIVGAAPAAATHVEILVVAITSAEALAGAPPPLPVGAATLAEQALQLAQETAAASRLAPATTFAQSALAASKIASAVATSLQGCSGWLDSTAPSATYYVQIIDASAAVTAGGAITKLLESIEIVHTTGAGNSDYWSFNSDIPLGGIAASTGIVVQLSSTRDTGTLSGAYLTCVGAKR